MRIKDPNGAVFHNSSSVFVHGDSIILSYPQPVRGHVITIDYDDHQFPLMVRLSNSTRRCWCSPDQCYIVGDHIDLMQLEEDDLVIKVNCKYAIEVCMHWMTQQVRISKKDYQRTDFCTHQFIRYLELLRKDFVNEGFETGINSFGIIRIGNNWDPTKIKSTSHLEILEDVKPDSIWEHQGKMALILKTTRNGKAYVRKIDVYGNVTGADLVYQSELKPWTETD